MQPEALTHENEMDEPRNPKVLATARTFSPGEVNDAKLSDEVGKGDQRNFGPLSSGKGNDDRLIMVNNG